MRRKAGKRGGKAIKRTNDEVPAIRMIAGVKIPQCGIKRMFFLRFETATSTISYLPGE